jgi:alpha-2-macroglobulin
MPKSALTDWLTAIDRTRGANTALRSAAEATLRQRIVYEGSRLDLTDKADAPWWMMSSGDEMANKALLSILGRPGWNDEEAKMMVGVALRQSRGHWDTTTANAWGTITARRFASRYPASAVLGVTSASLGNQTLTQNWPKASDSAPLRLALPMTRTPLILRQAGGSGPWAAISLSAAVPLTQPLFAGYRIEKSVSAISQAKSGVWTRGDVMKVRISVTAAAGRNWVVVSDPVPPGATIVGSLGGQSAILAQKANGGEGAFPSYIERGNDAWRGYFEWVPEGKFIVEYAVRLNGTGQFKLPPTKVEAMYSPDIRGLFPNGPVTVAMR